MALPALDATFASAADLPRRQMLAKWLVEELGSGSVADYWTLPEKYLWAKIAVAAGGPKTEADYISLPKNYAWSDIYNAVASASGSHVDWTEKQALGHIAAAYRGDTENPEALATYINWPWRYQVASIISALTSEEPPEETYDYVIVSGAGSGIVNRYYTAGEMIGNDPKTIVYTSDTFTYGEEAEVPNQFIRIFYEEGQWYMALGIDPEGSFYIGSDADYPWLSEWNIDIGDGPNPTLTPTNTPDEGGTINNIVFVSGAGSEEINGTYYFSTYEGGYPIYMKSSGSFILFEGDKWVVTYAFDPYYASFEDTPFPWETTGWEPFESGEEPVPTFVPTNV